MRQTRCKYWGVHLHFLPFLILFTFVYVIRVYLLELCSIKIVLAGKTIVTSLSSRQRSQKNLRAFLIVVCCSLFFSHLFPFAFPYRTPLLMQNLLHNRIMLQIERRRENNVTLDQLNSLHKLVVECHTADGRGARGGGELAQHLLQPPHHADNVALIRRRFGRQI